MKKNVEYKFVEDTFSLKNDPDHFFIIGVHGCNNRRTNTIPKLKMAGKV